jgi:hypothetical protein
MDWLTLHSALALSGLVVPGHGVASGRSLNSPYPQGSVSMQLPFFKALGLDLSDCWPGTLNVSIAPKTWALERADYCFEHVSWTHLHPPETFSFVRIQLAWQTQKVNAWIYRPHPETKAAHHQAPTTVELLAPHLNGVAYGDRVDITCQAGSISVH